MSDDFEFIGGLDHERPTRSRLHIDLAHAWKDLGVDTAFILRKQQGELLTQLPHSTTVADLKAPRVRNAFFPLVRYLEATPPDLAADIVDRGVMLTGGGALLGELDLSLREQTGLSISVANESLNCVALGTGKALEYEKQLRHVIDYDT